jgi:hypothetical protein
VDSPKAVVDAAHAAASWARARRAVWAGERPLPAAPPPPTATPLRERTAAAAIVEPPKPTTVAETRPIVAAAVTAPTPARVETQPPIVEASPHDVSADAAPGAAPHAIVPYLPRIAAALVAVVVLVAGGRWIIAKVTTWRASAPATAGSSPEPATAPSPAASTRKGVGVLRVTSTPAGAQVVLDGKSRGVTPLSLDDVPAGAHNLDIVSAEGTVHRAVAVSADHPVDVVESIFAGWLAVHAPFDLAVTEGPHALRADDRGQILLPPGRHEVRVVNRAVAYDQLHRVEVRPGEITVLDIALPRSTLSVTSSEPAEVFVDGARVGPTPLTDAAIDVGTREIVVRRASGGERRFTATVTTKPYTLNVDFSR